jgi:3-hydroxy-9,10-secoandrosta-1,3,5(10)-triene-9,17-dione monooxygenase
MAITADALVIRALRSTDQELVSRATSLVPVLLSRSAETDTIAKVPDATIADLEKARLFGLLVPKMYGGLQCSLRTYMDVVVEIARGDGSVGWALSLTLANTWMAATLYPKRVVDEVFSSGNFRTAGVLGPRIAKTRRVDGGVVIEEGLWSFNSGIHHSHWDILGIPILNDAGQIIDMGSALIPRSQIELLNDWDTIGLRGSGSTSVAVKDVFVPNERIAPLSKTLQEDYASSHLQDEPLYRLPLIPFLASKLVFPALGIAKAALQLFLEKAQSRSIPYLRYEKQSDAAITHLQIGEASAKIDAAELMLWSSLDQLEENAVNGTRLTLEQRARIWRNAGVASRLTWEAVDLLASASGGSFAYTKNPMNRLWRDARVAGMHGGIYPNTPMEVFGRILSGKGSNADLLQ